MSKYYIIWNHTYNIPAHDYRHTWINNTSHIFSVQYVCGWNLNNCNLFFEYICNLYFYKQTASILNSHYYFILLLIKWKYIGVLIFKTFQNLKKQNKKLTLFIFQFLKQIPYTVPYLPIICHLLVLSTYI